MNNPLQHISNDIQRRLSPFFDVASLSIRPIDSAAQLAWEEHWAPYTQDKQGAINGNPKSKNNRSMFYWFESEENLNSESFHASIWSRDTLCGLARGKKTVYDSSFNGYLRCVEGAPFDHPLKKLIHPIAIAAAISHCQAQNLSVLVADAPFSHGNIHDTYRRFNFAANPESKGITKNIHTYALRTHDHDVDFSCLSRQGPNPLKLATDFCL